MPSSACKIVGIMRGRNLHGTRSKGHVDELPVKDDRDPPMRVGIAAKWVQQRLSMKMLVAWIIGVDRHGGIAEHGLKASRRDDKLIVSIVSATLYANDVIAELVLLSLEWPGTDIIVLPSRSR